MFYLTMISLFGELLAKIIIKEKCKVKSKQNFSLFSNSNEDISLAFRYKNFKKSVEFT